MDPARSWFTSFTWLPAPISGPRSKTRAATASKAGLALAKACGSPDAMTVMSPMAALAAPPEIGPSMKRSPASRMGRARARTASGAQVAHWTTTEPGVIAATAPASPKSAACACSALTTTQKRTSACAPTSAGEVAIRPPFSAKLCAAAGLGSKPQVSIPARTSEAAMPSPMEPKPTTPARMVCVVISRVLPPLSNDAPIPRIGLARG